MNDNFITKRISINEDYINNYVLQQETGTKKVKETFYKNAVNNRNNYINKELNLFNKYKKDVYMELIQRKNKLLPKDKTEEINKNKEQEEKAKNIFIYTSSIFPFDYKLRFNFLLSKVKEGMSLKELNKIIKEIIEIFNKADIELKPKDFGYTMFTYEFMNTYLFNINNNNFEEITLKKFNELFYACPTLILQLKYSFYNIIRKNQKQLETYINKLNKNQTEKETLNNYLQSRTKYEESYDKDEFYNLNSFLDKKKNITDYIDDSPTRIKYFNTFEPNNDFSKLKDEVKTTYHDSIIDLYNTLRTLKDFYRYEDICKAILKLYDERKDNTIAYNSKKKELDQENKKRETFYKEYLKATKKSLFSKPNKEKERLSKLHMNESFDKIVTLNNEICELELSNILNKKLNDASSLYDLFASSYQSYEYLEKQFYKLFEKETDFDLEKEFERYFYFIFSPYNFFLRKVNAKGGYDIATIVSEKYTLLNINLSKEDIVSDKIDSKIMDTSFIKKVYDVESSNITFKQINFIVKVNSIDPGEEIKFLITPEKEVI